MMFGSALGGDVPAFTAEMIDESNPDRARETCSARYTARPLRTKYSFHPMRPSGVVSHVLLLRQQPSTITTGACRPAFTGIWYCTYIWFTVMSAGPAAGPATAEGGAGFTSPPTKKLP